MRILGNARVLKHRIELAALQLDLHDKTVEIAQILHVSLHTGHLPPDLLYGHSSLGIAATCNKDICTFIHTSFTERFAVARPMPLLLPAISAMFLSNLLIIPP